jgi:hypothetical protein
MASLRYGARTDADGVSAQDVGVVVVVAVAVIAAVVGIMLM